jgi:hypothetical protein
MFGCGDTQISNISPERDTLECNKYVSLSWIENGTSKSIETESNNQQIQGGVLHIYKDEMIYIQVDLDSIINYNSQ